MPSDIIRPLTALAREIGGARVGVMEEESRKMDDKMWALQL